jgi:hypothetical protein
LRDLGTGRVAGILSRGSGIKTRAGGEVIFLVFRGGFIGGFRRELSYSKAVSDVLAGLTFSVNMIVRLGRVTKLSIIKIGSY